MQSLWPAPFPNISSQEPERSEESPPATVPPQKPVLSTILLDTRALLLGKAVDRKETEGEEEEDEDTVEALSLIHI